MPSKPPNTNPTRKGQAGVTLIEVLFGSVILAIALLAHVSSTFTEYRLARTERTRSEALLVARQFLERMRSDEDWAGLYGRLRTMQDLAALSGPEPRLQDGRRSFLPTVYYPDFVPPESLRELTVLVDVPASTVAPSTIREDIVSPRFGLPSDLNGDGVVDGDSRQADYEALPVVVTLRWNPTGEASHQLRVSTWLRGYR